MRKKRVYLLGTFTVLLVAGLFTLLVAVVKHEPNFYERSGLPAGYERKQLSSQFVADVSQLLVDAGVDRGRWAYAFSDAQLNSFFQEDFIHYGEAENLRKLRVSEPRIIFEDDRIRLAFRYGSGFWSTVLSYDLKVWLVPNEPNALAIEFLARRAGALPISSQALVGELAELGSRHNIDVTAYRHQGHPVALIRFQADRARPTTRLQGLTIAPATLTLAGSSTDAPPAPSLKKLAPAAN